MGKQGKQKAIVDLLKNPYIWWKINSEQPKKLISEFNKLIIGDGSVIMINGIFCPREEKEKIRKLIRSILAGGEELEIKIYSALEAAEARAMLR